MQFETYDPKEDRIVGFVTGEEMSAFIDQRQSEGYVRARRRNWISRLVDWLKFH